MSLRTKADVEHHAMAVAIGLSGLKIQKHYGISTPELEQFESYLEKTKKFTLPSTHPKLEAILNEELKSVKEHVKSGNFGYAITGSEMIYNYLARIHNCL